MTCVRSGYCCKVAPCPWGRVNEQTGYCEHLKGSGPGFYECARYEEIKQAPDSHLCPAFGAGCSSTLFNTDRELVILRLRQEKP